MRLNNMGGVIGSRTNNNSSSSSMSGADLERIYDEHAVAMFRHGLTVLRGDEAAVHDLIQDLFVKLAEGRGNSGGMEHERAYLLRMVHHAALDRLRRAKVRGAHEMKPPAVAGWFQQEPDPDREAFRQELEKALDALPDEQRTVVVMKLWQELTFDEISRICDIPLNTAATRCDRRHEAGGTVALDRGDPTQHE